MSDARGEEMVRMGRGKASQGVLTLLSDIANMRKGPLAARRAMGGGKGVEREPRSLRLRLALWYGALLAVALTLFAGLILLLSADALNSSVETAISAEARGVQTQLHTELSATPPYWPERLTLQGLDAYRDPGVAIEIRDKAGQVRYRSPGGAPEPADAGALAAAAGGTATWFTGRVDGERVRAEAIPARAGENGPVVGVLIVGKSLAEVDATLRLLRTLLVVMGLGILAAALAGGWGIANRVLRPLGEIGATARSIAATTAQRAWPGSLSQRVRRPSGHDEMAQVVDTFNEMLDSLEDATRIQRRFVADASHELRAPLTTIQGNLAFLQRHVEALSPAERRTMLSDAHNETLRLAHLVDDLLMLARADASTDGQSAGRADAGEVALESVAARGQPAKSQPAELDRAILQLVRQLRARLASEGAAVSLTVGHIEPARVRGDEETLRRIALILLDNAIKYTPAGADGRPGEITVSLERRAGQAVLRVRDTGMGIAAEDLPHIFERFYRADRARDRQGTGLGLSIAETLAHQLGGRITAESIVGQGSTFSVWLPLA
ncbi:MAG: ATP-binding region, ATPase-like:Histidine kinase A, N-terminal:Propeptide, PepSY amd peptidase M4 [Ktedonobacterales bacterium]|nr:MAG: ATP-binding region, ATPase-like:Histidine kinase A, N-terminal:Propeptide, PepSY amd peptidase M4 [Ktedonobacterales bacterium]